MKPIPRLPRITNIYTAERVDGVVRFTIESPTGNTYTIDPPDNMDCGIDFGLNADVQPCRAMATMFIASCTGQDGGNKDEVNQKLRSAVDRLAEKLGKFVGDKIQLTGTFLQSFIIEGE